MPKAIKPDNLHQLQAIQTVEEMTEVQTDALLDLETYLTLYQIDLLLKAATEPNWQVPLWGHHKKESWAKSLEVPAYYAPSILDELELREFLQCKELERLQLIRLSQQDIKKEVWQLTARGHLLVIWHLRTVADYQALLNPQGLMLSPATTTSV